MAQETDPLVDQRIKPSSIAPFALRLQPEVKAALERAAQTAGRSLNAEIAARLERSLQGESETEARLSALEREVESLKEWAVPPFMQREDSGLARRQHARNLLAAFRAEFGYSADEGPDPLVEPDAFFEKVDADIDASPEVDRAIARSALAELMNAVKAANRA